ncbi:Sma protein [Toxoplasma gondii ARI]|uniref:Sma protein n=1 Tax=Toxoplasma gondii ARI TaxID=1074872 RepID=A0A139XNH2_TOXGO|nr:Sma protein [Toxoplasma gondii ARI]
MGQEDDKTRLPDGRPAEFATKRHEGEDDDDEEEEDDEDREEPLISSSAQRATVPYEWPYRTLVLRKILGEFIVFVSLCVSLLGYICKYSFMHKCVYPPIEVSV